MPEYSSFHKLKYTPTPASWLQPKDDNKPQNQQCKASRHSGKCGKTRKWKFQQISLHLQLRKIDMKPPITNPEQQTRKFQTYTRVYIRGNRKHSKQLTTLNRSAVIQYINGRLGEIQKRSKKLASIPPKLGEKAEQTIRLDLSTRYVDSAY